VNSKMFGSTLIFSDSSVTPDDVQNVYMVDFYIKPVHYILWFYLFLFIEWKNKNKLFVGKSSFSQLLANIGTL